MAIGVAIERVAASYAALELRPGAPLAEATEAYRRLARETHPDRAGSAATPRFVEVRAAYETLRSASAAGNAWRRARALESYAQPKPRPSRLVDAIV